MPPTVTRERSAGCRLRRDPGQVSQARRLVRGTLTEWGLDGYIDHTMLITSELVTNALRHGAGMISIRLYRARGGLRIEVHDHGAGRPVRRHAGTAQRHPCRSSGAHSGLPRHPSFPYRAAHCRPAAKPDNPVRTDNRTGDEGHGIRFTCLMPRSGE